MGLMVDKTKVLEEFEKADEKGRKLLESIFGKLGTDMTEIKSYEDALKITGMKDVEFSNVPAELRKSFEAQYKLIVITKALNQGWVPNWDNGNQAKYYPYFYMSPSGFAFYYTYYLYSYAYAGDGSRLCFRTSELAAYAGRKFIEVYKDLMI